MADRWVTDYVVDARRADVIERTIASHYDSDHYQATEAEYQEMADSPDLEDAPTENARCVWLPVTLSAEGVPQIKWHDSWKVEDFCPVLPSC